MSREIIQASGLRAGWAIVLLLVFVPTATAQWQDTAEWADSLVTVTALVSTGDDGTWRRHVGTGVIVAPGRVITSSYVLTAAEEIFVDGPEGRRVPATAIGGDGLSRLALLSVPAPLGTPIDMATCRQPSLGEPIALMGTAYGFPGKLSPGIVSGLDRTIMDEGLPAMSAGFEVSASAEPGMSGAPVLAADGSLVGIVLISTIPESGSTFFPLDGGQLVAYNLLLPESLPEERRQGPAVVVANPLVLCAEGDTFRYVAESLLAGGEVTWGRVGLSVGPTPMDAADHLALGSQRGATVLSVATDGPAAAAGLMATDIIVGVDGTALSSGGDLMREVLTRPGETIEIEYLRDGERHATSLELGTAVVPGIAPSQDARDAWVGLLVAETSDALTQQIGHTGPALSVLSVAPGSPALAARLEAGDVIVAVGGADPSLDRLASAVEAKTPIQLRVIRHGKAMDIQVTPGAAPPGVVLHTADFQLGMTEL